MARGKKRPSQNSSMKSSKIGNQLCPSRKHCARRESGGGSALSKSRPFSRSAHSGVGPVLLSTLQGPLDDASENFQLPPGWGCHSEQGATVGAPIGVTVAEADAAVAFLFTVLSPLRLSRTYGKEKQTKKEERKKKETFLTLSNSTTWPTTHHSSIPSHSPKRPVSSPTMRGPCDI